MNAVIPVHDVAPLRVGGHRVAIRTNCADYAAACDDVFIDLRHDGTTSSGQVVFEVIRHDAAETTWSIRRDGNPCELELSTDAVVVHQQWELNRLLIENNQTVVHAAVVASATAAILLAGRSHSGKTTMAGWLAAIDGYTFVADEAAAVGPSGVTPYLRPLGIRPGGPLAAHLPPLSRAATFMPEERLVPASQLGAALRRQPTPIGLIVFPRYRAGSATSIARLSQADTLERLARQTPGLRLHGLPVFERLTSITSAAAAIEVSYADVDSAADAITAVAHGLWNQP